MSSRGPEPMVTESKLRKHIQQHENPFITATDMAESMGVARQTAYKHLQRMYENGKLEKEKIGGSAVIWWLSKKDN